MSALPWAAAANSSATTLARLLECVDSQPGCPAWAAGGECAKNPGFMAASCRLSCNACVLSGEEALKATEVCRFAARNLLGLHHSVLTGGTLDGSSAGSEGGEVRGRVRELMVDALGLLETCGSRHENVNAALMRVADEIRASVDATCGAGAYSAGASARLECAPPPSAAAAGRIAAAAATAPPRPAGSGESRVVLLRGADGQPSVQMPLVGLGTWLTTGAECERLVAAGLAAGLRAIDGSENYFNSDAIGRAVEASGVPRSELFLASKLSHAASYSREGARAALTAQLHSMRTSYLDLFMLHSVGPSVNAMREAWGEMRAMQAEGLVRAVGVSNFQITDLESLLAHDSASTGGSVVATLQNKFSPYHPGALHTGGVDYARFCRDKGITLVAYCPLNAWPSALSPLDDVLVAHIAIQLNRTPAQVPTVSCDDWIAPEPTVSSDDWIAQAPESPQPPRPKRTPRPRLTGTSARVIQGLFSFFLFGLTTPSPPPTAVTRLSRPLPPAVTSAVLPSPTAATPRRCCCAGRCSAEPPC